VCLVLWLCLCLLIPGPRSIQKELELINLVSIPEWKWEFKDFEHDELKDVEINWNILIE